ncbi:MAG: TonB-dependent receptor [Ignavibacteriales bacterium]|nr:TonB-dependent receptor [Ignavibacteriales bacterium]
MKHRFALLTILFCPRVILSQPIEREDTTKTYVGKEVVITSSRSSGEVLDLPLAVGVVNIKDILGGRKLGLDEALSLVPGVFAQSRSGGQDIRLTIRGFGARGNGDRSNAGTVRGIKILLDGIPETEPDGRTPLDLIDLNATERIEVVRSNASTLFGNASGGVINLRTGSGTRETFAETHNMFGDFGFRKSNVSVGGEFGTNHFFLSGSNTFFEGWRQNSSSRSTQLHSVVDSRLGEKTNLRLFASGASNIFFIPGALTLSEFESTPSSANQTYFARKERRKNRTGRLAFDLFTSFGGHHSVDVLAYITPKVQTRSERGTFRDFNRYHLGGGVVYSWTGDQNSFLKKLLIGVDEAYQDGTNLFYNLVNGERGDSLRTNKREAAETFGVFFQSELRLMDQFNLALGARYDDQRYIVEEYAAGVNRLNVPERLSLDHITPKISALYRYDTNHSLYASISGGLEAPAFNEIDPPPSFAGLKLNPFLAPMTSTTYEAGFKGVEVFDDESLVESWSYSLAAYRIDIRNEIVPYNGGAYYFSAGQSRRHGLELAAQAFLFSGLSITSSITYLDAEYVSYLSDSIDYKGNNVPGISNLLFNSRVRFVSSVGLTIELGIEHWGEYFADDANLLRIPSATTLNSSVGYSFLLGPLTGSLMAGVHNLLDLKYASSAFINPVEGSYLEPGLPRNIFAGFNVKSVL